MIHARDEAAFVPPRSAYASYPGPSSMPIGTEAGSAKVTFMRYSSGRFRKAAIDLVTAAAPVMMAAVLAVPLLAADRPSDKDVKQLLERIDHERDRFEDQLDGKIKHNILRGPGGEVDVSKYLDDLQENVKKMEERFSSQYAASAEVTTVLRQGSDIERFMATQPPNLDGASEWNRLASSLGELASAYGTTFPMPEGQQARRLNDNEVKAAATDVAKGAEQFRKALDSSYKQNTSMDKASRESALKSVDTLKETAKKLAGTIGGKPASGEAQAMLDAAATIRGGMAGRPPAVQSAWSPIESSLEKVAQAFNAPAR
jgi:hypothetical protein